MATVGVSLTKDVFDRICEQIADGASLRSVCRQESMPSKSLFFRFMREHPEHVDQYTRATEERCVALAEDALDICDDGSNDWMESNDPNNKGYELKGEHIQRSKLRVETRKWFLSKLKAKVYGDKSAVELSGSVDIAQSIMAARKRVAKKD